MNHYRPKKIQNICIHHSSLRGPFLFFFFFSSGNIHTHLHTWARISPLVFSSSSFLLQLLLSLLTNPYLHNIFLHDMVTSTVLDLDAVGACHRKHPALIVISIHHFPYPLSYNQINPYELIHVLPTKPMKLHPISHNSLRSFLNPSFSLRFLSFSFHSPSILALCNPPFSASLFHLSTERLPFSKGA